MWPHAPSHQQRNLYDSKAEDSMSRVLGFSRLSSSPMHPIIHGQLTTSSKTGKLDVCKRLQCKRSSSIALQVGQDVEGFMPSSAAAPSQKNENQTTHLSSNVLGDLCAPVCTDKSTMEIVGCEFVRNQLTRP